MKYALALAAVAGIAGTALAGNTRFVLEVSGDNGASWGPSVTVAPGTLVRARLSAVFVGSEAVTGLAGFNTTFQIQNWDAAQDTLAPWDPSFTDITGAAGGVVPGGNGRQKPFAAPSTSILPVTTVAAPNLNITGSVNGRIPIGQGPSSLAGAFYNPSTSPVVFMFSFTPTNTTSGNRVLNLRTTSAFNTNEGNAKWYTGTGSSNINAAEIDNDLRNAVCTVTPTPGTLALLGLGGLVAGRRRR